MLKKLLIANRGEIAIRVARTAADMGIETVAVYPDDDAQCLHVRHADHALKLPGRGVAAYLDIREIVNAALHAGCDSIHPGYGLLSERADFAMACADAGLVFVGPSPETLAQLGDKTLARSAARALGIPVIEGRDDIRTAADLAAFFDENGGVPVMIKAAMGGGGRGMRVIENADQIDAAFSACQSEALTAFGDGRLYGERFLPNVRHVEVQIIGDGKTVTHLWDRDCTLQRRNQKIIELAPAPGLNPDLRAALLAAAQALARAADYRGLGTVEFLVEPNATATSGYYFIETNPRIQVEHTVTEDWAGVDLVETQLRIAGGAPLDQIALPDPTGPQPTGFALQCRINTERMGPDGTVTPTGGRLDGFVMPGGRGVRVETHGYVGYETNPGFDSLLAKIIVSSQSGDLNTTLNRANRVLGECHIAGIDTNIALLRAVLTLPDLADWAVDVRFIERMLSDGSLQQSPQDSGGFFDTASVNGSADTQPAQTPSFPEGSVPVVAPMQAILVSFEATEGETLQRGQTLAIIEAMKMQHEVNAPMACRVQRHLCAPGQTVQDGAALLVVEETDDVSDKTQGTDTFDPDMIRPDLQGLLDRVALTLDAKRPDAVTRRRSRGQRTARENLADLLQDGSFIEYGQFVHAAQRRRRDIADLQATSPADGIITGVGTVNGDLFGDTGTQVAILAYDGSVMAGTQGMMGHKKTDRLLELARDQKLPVIFYTEGGGGRPGDTDFADTMCSGLDVMTFNLMTRLTADKPSIGINSGYCFAGNAAVFGACDVKIATRNSWIGLGGPAMVEAGGLGAWSPKDIGPAPMQAEIGLVDLLAEDEAHATTLARQVLGCFQGAVTEWAAPDQRLLRHAIPENRKRAYDIRAVINGLVDMGSFIEMRAQFASGMITGLVRIEGQPFGLIANNPMHLGGALDAKASTKAAGFLTLCGRFNLPVISLCDTPGFMVGPASERDGGVQAACSMIAAGAQLDSALFTVVLRKGYGIGAQAMAGGSFAAPFFTISWPTGEFGAMGLEGAVELGYKKELDAQPDAASRQALFDQLVAQSYAHGRALNVASVQEIDAVIDPQETRAWILNGVRGANTKR